MTGPAAQGRNDDLWARLRSRKVVQWGVAYAAGAWGFLQALEYLSETYEWPSQLRKVAVLALLIGLPFVLVLAWYHGDRGVQRVNRVEAAVLLLLLALGGGVLWRYQPTNELIAGVGERSTFAPLPAVVAADPRPSIAILPFENRSLKQEDVFFVDGIHDDIQNRLTTITALRVIAPTSVDQLHGSKLSTREIGVRLGATQLLAGAVQRVADRVRINVKLIDAASDAQVWAESYDREFTAASIFSIQSEVAAAISGRLRSALAIAANSSAEERPETSDLRAWQFYQLANQAADRGGGDGLIEAESLYRRAIEADPRFARAYIGLAHTLVGQINLIGAPREETLAKAAKAAETALQLAPDLADAWTVAARMVYEQGDDELAQARFLRAIKLNPNNAEAYEKLSDLMWDQGRREDSLRYAEKAVALDPLSIGARQSLAVGLAGAGRFDETETVLRQNIAFDPLFPLPYVDLAEFLAYTRNRFIEAVPLGEKAVALGPDNPTNLARLASLYWDVGNDAAAIRLMDDAAPRWPDRSYVQALAAWLAVSRGDMDGAVRRARRLLETNPGHMGGIVVLVQADMRKKDFAAARQQLAIADPDLLVAKVPNIVPSNLGFALGMATVLMKTGETDRARLLLDRSEQFIRKLRRLGEGGYGIFDARIFALRGDKPKALRALRTAVRAGWRGPWRRAQLDFDFAFESLRGDPEYRAILAELDRDLARQRAELAARSKQAQLGPITTAMR